MALPGNTLEWVHQILVHLDHRVTLFDLDDHDDPKNFFKKLNTSKNVWLVGFGFRLKTYPVSFDSFTIIARGALFSW